MIPTVARDAPESEGRRPPLVETGTPPKAVPLETLTRSKPSRATELATVLGAVKTKPQPAPAKAGGGRKGAAGLDSPCARWRRDRAVGTEEWLRRGRTKE